MTRPPRSGKVLRIVLRADGQEASPRSDPGPIRAAFAIALVVSLVGCGEGASAPKADSGPEAARDSAASRDVAFDASAESDLGEAPVDLAAASPEAHGSDGGGGDSSRLDGGAVDGAGGETSAEGDAAQADSPATDSAVRAMDVDAVWAADVGANAGGVDVADGGPDAVASAPMLDGAALNAAEFDARSDALDGNAATWDAGVDRMDGPLPRIWVYVMAGQSNMLGQAFTADLSAADAQSVPNAEIYFVSPLETNSHMKAWLPVAPGLGWHDDRFGPEVGFARRYHALYPDRHLAVIKVSQGATELFDVWKAPTGSLYQLLVKTVLQQLQVLAARGRPELAGFLWMQGESDGTVLEHANAYRDNLLGMIQQLRTDLALATMPAVAALIATDCCWAYADTIRKSTTQVSTMVGNMSVVETDDLPMSKREVGHYSASAQIELGARFANAATALLGSQWKFPDRLSTVQGDSCFTYRERTGADTTAMTFDAARGAWEGASGASIGNGGLIPAASADAELAWSAPFAGTFQITVSATLPDPVSSGTQIEISDGNRTVWGPWSIGSGRTVTTMFPRDMEQKDRLYFRTSAGARSDPSRDATSWQIAIDTKSVR